MDPIKKQKELQDYKESLKGKTLEELKKLEQDLIVNADENDQKISQLEYDLPEENYEVVATAIQGFLNKEEVQWQYTLAMVAMYDFWDPKKKAEKISYPMLDSVLRTLGNLKFTGYSEWAAIVAINKYFEPLRESYASALEGTYDISAKHDAILSAMEELQKKDKEQMINE